MDDKHPVRILHVMIGDGTFGGVASFLYNYYAHMDHDRIHFDFLYCGKNSMASKESDPVLSGSRIITLNILKRVKNGVREYRQLIPALKQFFRQEKYDIVHVNCGNVYVNVCVAYALRGRAILICHSHIAQSTIQYEKGLKTAIKTIVKSPCRRYLYSRATVFFACSEKAGLNLFGEKGIHSSKFRVINNAIDTAQFAFNPQKRAELRKEDRYILGFVGRLSDEKNPCFAIDVFSKVHESQSNTALWIIGEGDLRSEVEAKVERLNLSDCVTLYGRRNDVADLMQAMDLLLFPSLFEGFGIVAVEAQCSGLEVLASDSVPETTNIAGLCAYLPIVNSMERWTSYILDKINSNAERTDRSDQVKQAQFDIECEAKKLEDLYLSML